MSIAAAASYIPTDPVLQGEPVALADRVEIFPQTPLLDLNTAAGPAFAARLKGESKANLYGIVCSEGLPPRGDILTSLMGKQHANLVRFRDSSMVDWPGGTTAGVLPARRYVLIFERPAGIKLSTMYGAGVSPQAPLDVEKLVNLLLRPLSDVVAEFSMSGFGHGAIYPDNMFISSGGVIQLGECASCPTSYAMPTMFLTLERAAAHPAGRGMARVSDDLYALGVMALIMMLGHNPVAHLSDDELMALRFERGSFMAFLGDRSLKGTATEVFRSLLEDDPRRRWTLEDLDVWLEGRRPSPKMIEAEMKPKRAFSVGDELSQNRRGVAHLLFKNPIKGAATVESGELQRWIERSIENENLTKRTREVFERAQTSNPPMPSIQLVARAGILIDPYGPIRFKETALMPSGFGTFLATRMSAGADIQPVIEMLQTKMFELWTEGQTDHRPDHIAVEQQLDRARMYLERKVIGYGIERMLYELMPMQPCLSPMIRNAGAMTAGQALRALDKIAENMGTQPPIDRHLAAFFIARDRRIHDGLLATLQAPEGSIRRVIGILSLLAEAQYRTNTESLKNLAQWMGRLLEPATKRFFEKAMQEKARRDLANAAARGDLIEMLNLLDSPDALEQDRIGFEDARVIWQQAELEILELQEDIDKREDVERRVGQPLASGLAVLLGIIALGFVIVMAVGGKFI